MIEKTGTEDQSDDGENDLHGSSALVACSLRPVALEALVPGPVLFGISRFYFFRRLIRPTYAKKLGAVDPDAGQSEEQDSGQRGHREIRGAHERPLRRLERSEIGRLGKSPVFRLETEN